MQSFHSLHRRLAAFAGTVALAAYWGLAQRPRAAPPAPGAGFFPADLQDLRMGDPAPTLRAVDGGPGGHGLPLGDGHPLALLLAGPCAQCSAPTFALWDGLYRKYGRVARVVIVSTSDPVRIRVFRHRQGYAVPIYHGSEEGVIEPWRGYWLPRAYFIDGPGRLRYVQPDEDSGREGSHRIADLLARCAARTAEAPRGHGGSRLPSVGELVEDARGRVYLKSAPRQPFVLCFFCGCSSCRAVARAWAGVDPARTPAIAAMSISPADARAFARSTAFRPPVAMDPGGELRAALDVAACPTLCVVSRDGCVVFRVAEPVSPKTAVRGVLEAWLRQARLLQAGESVRS